MRVVVVGTIVADTIEHGDGRVTESLGGIAHTVSVLSALGGGDLEIVPVCRAGNDCRERVEAWAGRLDGVRLAAVRWIDEPHPRVRLSYAEGASEGERVERLRNAPLPLLPADVRRAGVADLALFNCITGVDCTPDALTAGRDIAARLYLDVHSLALGTAPDGRRAYRRRDDWHQWLSVPSVVQCNRAEAATLCGLPVVGASDDEVVAAVVRRTADGKRRAEGPAVWLLTLGAAGAVVLERSREGVAHTRVAAPDIDAVDPTGAGDAFGAAFVSHWLGDRDPVAAARYATRVAAAATMMSGAPDPAGLRRRLARLPTE